MLIVSSEIGFGPVIPPSGGTFLEIKLKIRDQFRQFTDQRGQLGFNLLGCMLHIGEMEGWR